MGAPFCILIISPTLQEIKSIIKTMAAIISNVCIIPPPILNKNPSIQNNTTIPPNHLRNPIRSLRFLLGSFVCVKFFVYML